MTNKTYNLIEGVTRGCVIVAVAVVSYTCDGGTAAVVDSALLIAQEAALKICKLFVKE